MMSWWGRVAFAGAVAFALIAPVSAQDNPTKPDEKPPEKKGEDKKPAEDKKPEDRKPEDKKPEDRKPEDRKPEDRKPEDRKPEDRKPEDKQPEETEKKDEKREDEAKPRAEKKGQKPPKVGDAVVVGEQLPPGTVARKGLYPLDEGRRWTYELRVWLESVREEGPRDDALLAEGPRLQRLEVKVGETQKIEGKDAKVLDSFLDGELIQRQFFFDGENELECARRVQGIGDHAKDNVLSPPQQFLKGDLKVGATWEWKGKIGTTDGTTSYEVLREEKVTVKAGTYSCLVVKATVSAEDESRGIRVQWLAPNVGLVREETEVRTPTEVWRTQGELVKSELPKKK